MVCPPPLQHVTPLPTCPSVLSSSSQSQYGWWRRATYYHQHFHHHRHQLHQQGFCIFSLCLVASVLASTVMAVPLNRDKPRWVNPCDLPGHVFDPNSDMEGAPSIPLAKLYGNVKGRAKFANSQAADVKDKFLKLIFYDDHDFIQGTAMLRQSWLPKIPSPTEEHFQELGKEEAFRKSFEYLQFFAVGIEQIILDQMIHDGQFVTLFHDIENYLTQILCELQMGLHVLRIATNPDVMRDVMSQDYRDISDGSRRNVRDYLILRDYVKATRYVSELFAYLERTL